MTIYAYRCRECRMTANLDRPMGEHPPTYICPGCGNEMGRDYSGVSTHRPMPTHFNIAAGQEIGSMRQMDEAMKRKSEEYYLRTGIEAKFVAHDHSDAKALGVTGEGLDSTNRRRVDQGLRPVEPKL